MNVIHLKCNIFLVVNVLNVINAMEGFFHFLRNCLKKNQNQFQSVV